MYLTNKPYAGQWQFDEGKLWIIVARYPSQLWWCQLIILFEPITVWYSETPIKHIYRHLRVQNEIIIRQPLVGFARSLHSVRTITHNPRARAPFKPKLFSRYLCWQLHKLQTLLQRFLYPCLEQKPFPSDTHRPCRFSAFWVKWVFPPGVRDNGGVLMRTSQKSAGLETEFTLMKTNRI